MSKDRHQGLMDLLDEIAAAAEAEDEVQAEEENSTTYPWRVADTLPPSVAKEVAKAIGVPYPTPKSHE